MLSNKDENICRLAVKKVQSLSSNMQSVSITADSTENGSNANPDVQLSIRQVVLPKLDLKAKSNHELVNLRAKDIEKLSR